MIILNDPSHTKVLWAFHHGAASPGNASPFTRALSRPDSLGIAEGIPDVCSLMSLVVKDGS
jgi:hypothetical protein